MIHARDRRRYFAAQFCRPYFVSQPLSTPSIALGVGVPLLLLTILGLFVCFHAAPGAVLAFTPVAVMKENRKKLISDMKALLDHADLEKRNLTIEENRQWDEMNTRLDALDLKIEQRDVVNPTMFENPAAFGGSTRAATRKGRTYDPNGTDHRSLLDRYYRDGEAGLALQERRALQADISESGGYMTLGQALSGEFITDTFDLTVIAPRARTFSVKNASSLGTPSLSAAPAAPTWGGEITAAAEDTTMKIGARVLSPHPCTLLEKVSNTLLRLGNPAPGDVVEEQIKLAFANMFEGAFCTGTGANQPLGIFTASNMGISTARDVSLGNSITSIGADNLFNCEEQLKQNHRPNAVWLFSRKATRILRQLKDGEGRYLWRDDMVNGQPPNLIGYPVLISEGVPNTFTTGLYVGALADLRYYWIATALEVMVQRLLELYAVSNQVGFLARCEIDAMPVLETAFVRVTLA
jgi:HK97 family phage major capsid protein